MQPLLKTTDITFLQSVQFALEAEGIDTAVSGNAALPFTPSTLFVDDTDLPRARLVLDSLQVPPEPVPDVAPIQGEPFSNLEWGLRWAVRFGVWLTITGLSAFVLVGNAVVVRKYHLTI